MTFGVGPVEYATKKGVFPRSLVKAIGVTFGEFAIAFGAHAHLDVIHKGFGNALFDIAMRLVTSRTHCGRRNELVMPKLVSLIMVAQPNGAIAARI